jgi:hypothetical protein
MQNLFFFVPIDYLEYYASEMLSLAEPRITQNLACEGKSIFANTE